MRRLPGLARGSPFATTLGYDLLIRPFQPGLWREPLMPLRTRTVLYSFTKSAARRRESFKLSGVNGRMHSRLVVLVALDFALCPTGYTPYILASQRFFCCDYLPSCIHLTQRAISTTLSLVPIRD